MLYSNKNKTFERFWIIVYSFQIFWASIFTSFLCSHSQSFVISLYFLNFLFVSLSFFHITTSQCDWINSLSTIRRQRLTLRNIVKTMIHSIHTSHIPPSLFIKIHITTIISINLRHLLTFNHYFTFKIFLSLPFNLSNFIVSIDVIFIIIKFHFTCYLHVKGSHYYVVDHVSWKTEFYLLTIWRENDLTASSCFALSWV